MINHPQIQFDMIPLYSIIIPDLCSFGNEAQYELWSLFRYWNFEKMIWMGLEKSYGFYSKLSLGIIICQFIIIKWVAFIFLSYYIFSFMNFPFHKFSFQNNMYKKLTDSISLPPQLLFESFRRFEIVEYQLSELIRAFSSHCVLGTASVDFNNESVCILKGN